MAFAQSWSQFVARLHDLSDSLKKRELIEDYLKKTRVPVVEDESVHFLYRGKGRTVAVPGEMNGWKPRDALMQRVPRTDLCYRTYRIPHNGRVEYKLWVDSTWMLDPLNPRTARGGHGENSDVCMPGYREPQDIRLVADIPPGSVDTLWLSSKYLKRKHPVLVYLPPGYTKRKRYPAIYVTDGEEYLSLGKMKTVLDHTIARGRSRPVVGVFIDPRTDLNDPSTNKRMVDYAASRSFCNFLELELVPHIEKRYSVIPDVRERVIMGASMGGLIATYIVLTRPKFIANCAAQSPAYFQADSAVIKLVRKTKEAEGTTISIDTGTINDTQVEARLVRDLLRSKGARVRYNEHPEGHNWSNWRARIGDILEYFFPYR